MEMKFFWLFITLYVLAATSAEPVRRKRDLTRIQNIIKWLLGINEQDTIYTVPAYQKFLLRTIPRTEINGNMRLLTEGLYPRKIYYRPVQIIGNDYPTVYNKYPYAIQGYNIINDRAYDHYTYGRPIYPYVNQPTYEESGASLCPLSVTTLEECGFDSSVIITQSNRPLPQPPMYIQNRVREIILNRSIPPVKLQKDIVVPPPGLRKVDVSEYSLIDDRMTYNTATTAKSNIEKENQFEAVPILRFTPEVDAESQSKTCSEESSIKKKVTFAAPVHTKFKYKMIYNNQPNKNTVVETDSTQSQIAKSKEETSTLKVNEITNEVTNPSTLTFMEDKIPSEYIYVPPDSTEILPPGIPTVDTNMKPANFGNNIDAIESRPIVTLDDAPFTNARHKNKPTKVIVRRRKIISQPENSRGDIPENSS